MAPLLMTPPGQSRPASVPADPLRPPWAKLLGLLVASRIFIYVVAGVSIWLVPKGPTFPSSTSILDWFMRWDAGWYVELVDGGYTFSAPGEPTNVVFFPAYPLLVRIVSLNGLLPTAFAGYLTSFGCLAVACVWLWQAVAREWRDERTATLAVVFLLCGPVSFFFNCIYSEPLFLPLLIGCIDRARRGHWGWAFVLGVGIGLTRFVGIVMAVPLAWEYLQQLKDRRSLRAVGAMAPAACLAPLLGAGLYCLYMWHTFGNPLMYFQGQLHWGRRYAWFYLLFYRESFSLQPLFYQIWFACTVATAFGLMLWGVFLRIPLTYTICALTFSFVYISSRFVEGLPRYFSVVFPFYAILGLIATRWPFLKWPLLGSCLLLQALSVALFVCGYWFT